MVRAMVTLDHRAAKDLLVAKAELAMQAVTDLRVAGVMRVVVVVRVIRGVVVHLPEEVMLVAQVIKDVMAMLVVLAPQFPQPQVR